MSAPRFVSPFRWEPLPYLVLVALLLLTGLIRPESGGWLVALLIAITLTAAWGVVGFVRERRMRNPDPMGDLTTLDGIEIVDASPVAAAVRAVVPVVDVHRHQPAIDLARLHGGASQHAILVPRARRWLSPKYRVGVQLVGGDRPRHAGFLGEAPDRRWRDALDELRVSRGAFVRVPAVIEGSGRPYRVDLDLSGLGAIPGGGDEASADERS
ncbi:hypothetical protein [Agromyces binzhouensis]|uniref:Uncharacterized protein n=1 Tax=Agromyces binzhouensis TaxID=1817495 RepID=A0A4Q2JTQ2_9MICO|nr:hypothetical protein [Agromyces binzhouensis]RXZ50119.1 hypothetical protein ESO86_03585 [Agromyces binzhouensis]